MSLDWDVSKVADSEATCFYIAEDDVPFQHKKGDRCVRPVTEALIFLTMPVGINRLTEENAETFYARAYAVERFGAFRTAGKGKPVYVTPEEVRAHVGLWTNASPKTAAAFGKTLVNYATSHAREAFRALAAKPRQNDKAVAGQNDTAKP